MHIIYIYIYIFIKDLEIRHIPHLASCVAHFDVYTLLLLGATEVKTGCHPVDWGRHLVYVYSHFYTHMLKMSERSQ